MNFAFRRGGDVTIRSVLEQAVAAHQVGYLSEAVRLYGLVLDEQPSNAVANYNLGVLSLEIEKIQAAIILFKNAIDSNPEEKQYWVSYIDALKRDGQFEKAEEVNEEALWYLNRQSIGAVEHNKDPKSPID
jgi:tetratricopeptide (TPR) repeat protein